MTRLTHLIVRALDCMIQSYHRCLPPGLRVRWVFPATLLLAWPAWAAETPPDSNAPPGGLSGRSTNVTAGFRLKPGFRLELVAAEPRIAVPVAIAFDEKGRLFVAETREAGSPRDTNAPAGRIRVLEDPDGTGEFRSSKVYADNLASASAVACYAGGVFVAAGSNILYLKDTLTNGIANLSNVVFSGFGGTNTLGAEVVPHNFNWGLDNRIHAAGVGTDPALPSRCFSFDPHGLTIAAGGGGAETGLALDNWGRELVCDLTRPLRRSLLPLRYRERNLFFPAPPEVADVLGPATPVFRLISAGAPQPTNVLAATWLTNARSCVVYRGNAFPSNFLGNAFIADASARVIHRAVLREAGLRLTASRAPEDARTEFLMSEDPAFRPVQIVNGPDGVLYVVDAQDGGTAGRIYRIVPQGFKPVKLARLGRATTAELVAYLSHPNGWHRDTAARLLYERRDPAAAKPLASMFSYSRDPLARLHALRALDGMGALSQEQLLRALRDRDERIREQAVLMAEQPARRGTLADATWRQLKLLAADPSMRVRYQLALTMGEIRMPDRPRVLADMLMDTTDHPLMQAAVFSSLADGAAEVLVALASSGQVRDSIPGRELLERLAIMIGVQGKAGEIARVIEFADQTPRESARALPALAAVGEGLRRAGISLTQMNPQGPLPRFYTEALNVTPNSLFPETVRLGAIRLLPSCPYTYSQTADFLLMLVGSGQSEAIRSAAIATLGSYDDPQVSASLIRRWRALTPRLRKDAGAALLSRADRLGFVLDAVEDGNIDRADLSDDQVNLLRLYPEPAIAERAVRLLGLLRAQRPEAVESFKAALRARGAVARGRQVFLARCAACHQPDNAAPGIGPELATVRMHGRERAMTAILEPNAAVRPGYETYLAGTVAGELFWGLLRGDNTATITLQQPDGRQVVLQRSNIQYLEPQPWSLMPEELTDDLNPQGMADLLEHVTAAPR
ncbi:MAG TPA: c-type cytochrome [Verrucomicrobiota bacterium]|nr:c-type cytochrome [Verrucomicrobiota bacterium]